MGDKNRLRKEVEEMRREFKKRRDDMRVPSTEERITALETALREAHADADGIVSRMKARRLLTSWGWVPVTGAPGDLWVAPNCASGSMSCPIEMALEYHGYRLEEEGDGRD